MLTELYHQCAAVTIDSTTTASSSLPPNAPRRSWMLQRCLLLIWPLSLHAFLTAPRFSPHHKPVITRSSSSPSLRRQQPFCQPFSTLLAFSLQDGADKNDHPRRSYDNNNSPPSITDDDTLRKYNVSLLLIDHYDSFTYNLYDMLAQLTVDPPVVIPKDAALVNGTTASMQDVVDFLDRFDGIVLSPGPGSPHEQPPLSRHVVFQPERSQTPILGVCLGHQLMALAYGARVDRAPQPIHGQDHWISIVQQSQQQQQEPQKPLEKAYTDNKSVPQQQQEQQQQLLPALRYPSLFTNLPPSFRVVRYHSLCAYDLLPTLKTDDGPPLVVTATSSGDDVVQGIQHVHYPHYGVQFHPESIGTQWGMDVLRNFVQVVDANKMDASASSSSEALMDATSSTEPIREEVPYIPQPQSIKNNPRFRVLMHKVPKTAAASTAVVEPLQVFDKYYAHQKHSMWLDSSSYPSRGELDILAAPTRDSDLLEYHQGHGRDEDILTRLEEELFGTYEASTALGWIQSSKSSKVPKLDEKHIEWRDEMSSESATTEVETPPFHYRGGYVGFLGYEVRHDTQRFLQQQGTAMPMQEKEKSGIPTAAFFLARQSMVYHHPTDSWYLIGLVERDEDVADSLEWMNSILSDFDTWTSKEENTDLTFSEDYPTKLEFIPNRSKEKYEQDIADCHEFIRQGDSYELCLTNQLEARVESTKRSTADLYRRLRRGNPAPYAAYFRWNVPSERQGDSRWVDLPDTSSLVICSSSPERFMSVSRQQPHPEVPSFLQAEAKPIKGTCARVIPQDGVSRTEAENREDERRARSLELSLKNRAENLMIVDLLRNDLSRVCAIGSVHVSKLMDIESFATVHQMVSTIRGTLPETKTAVDLLRASFPGGSMTGAPKIRTMELLEELEQGVERGPYSGSLGYLSVNGCMDMNIIIRSAVLSPSDNMDSWKVSIGAGGAITALSEAEDEYEEMKLKARAVVAAVQDWAALRVVEVQSELQERNMTTAAK